MLFDCLAIGAGGALGAVGRYLLGLLPIKMGSGFPITTLFINIIGAFFIGMIAGAIGKGAELNTRLVLFLKVGICGGFTTFSTFSLEALTLLQNGKYTAGILYMVLSVVLCILACIAGELLIKKIK